MPGRDLKSMHQTVKQIIDRQEVKKPSRATVYSIDGRRIDVYVPGSPGIMRHIEVVGEIERLRVGVTVALRWEHDRPQAMIVAEAGTDPGDFRKSIPVDGVTILWGDNGLELAQGGIGLGHLTFDPLLGGSETNVNVFTESAKPVGGDFVWRRGRAGGQFIYGGIGADQDLDFYANSVSGGWINLHNNTKFSLIAEFDGAVYFDAEVRVRDADTSPFIIHATPTTAFAKLRFGDTDFIDVEFQQSTRTLKIGPYLTSDSDLFAVTKPIKLSEYLELDEQATTPSDVDSGYGRLYMLNTGGLWFMNDSDKWELTADLTYGEISKIDHDTDTVITDSDAVQVLVFDTVGPANNTVPSDAEDHIYINKAGDYMITVSATINSVAAGGGSVCRLTVEKNNGATQVGALVVQRTLAGGGTEYGSISLSGVATLSSTDTIEVWIQNLTNTDNYIVQNITLSVVQLSGYSIDV